MKVSGIYQDDDDMFRHECKRASFTENVNYTRILVITLLGSLVKC